MQTSETYFNTKKLIAVIVLVAVLGFVVYLISANQKLNVNNKAASNMTPLDNTMASQAMVMGYSEASKSGAKYTLYVSVPHSFAFTPKKLLIENTEVNKNVDIAVTETKIPYRCMSSEDEPHDMHEFVSDTFTQGLGETLDTDIKVIFTDNQNNEFESTYQLSHMCTVFADDYGEVVTPVQDNTIPSE